MRQLLQTKATREPLAGQSVCGVGKTVDSVTATWVAEARRRNEDLDFGRAKAVPEDEFKTWFNAL